MPYHHLPFAFASAFFISSFSASTLISIAAMMKAFSSSSKSHHLEGRM
nr:MAG TPA: hypothetical protein [Caudoviricetes sp.]